MQHVFKKSFEESTSIMKPDMKIVMQSTIYNLSNYSTLSWTACTEYDNVSKQSLCSHWFPVCTAAEITTKCFYLINYWDCYSVGARFCMHENTNSLSYWKCRTFLAIILLDLERWLSWTGFDSVVLPTLFIIVNNNEQYPRAWIRSKANVVEQHNMFLSTLNKWSCIFVVWQLVSNRPQPTCTNRLCEWLLVATDERQKNKKICSLKDNKKRWWIRF